jgi:DNA-binding Lrp family transcriptional regulator
VSEEIVTLDELDHQLLHALQLDARVPFARFAKLVGTSEQTVARRFRRLRTAGVVRVVGMVDPAALGEASWIVRIQARPDAALALAEALARRSDVGWLTLVSGGSEMNCVIRSRTSRQRDELLLQRLPKTAQVLGVTAHSMLRIFAGPPDWITGGGLEPAAVEHLLTRAIGGGLRPVIYRDADAPGPGPALTADDEALLDLLATDARTPVSALAERTGWTPARVNRRMEELVRSGLLYFDAEVAFGVLGFRALAFLWLTVAPARLHAVGEAIAAHGEAVFVAATTGASNLVASVICRDQAHLYRYVTESLGSLEGLTGIEIAPSLRRIKQGGTRMTDNRLVVS